MVTPTCQQDPDDLLLEEEESRFIGTGDGSLDWKTGLRLAKYIAYWALIRPEDIRDFLQDALVEMMERARRNGGGLSDKEMWRAARCVRNRYWRAYQRGQRMVSLNTVVNESGTELWETIPDPAADLSDLPERLDAQAQLAVCPPRVLAIAAKRASGQSLTRPEMKCLQHFSRKRLGRVPRKYFLIAAERLKELREKRGWSREQLALRSGVAYGGIFRIEKGGTKLVRSDTLERLARALGVSQDRLVLHPSEGRVHRVKDERED